MLARFGSACLGRRAGSGLPELAKYAAIARGGQRRYAAVPHSAEKSVEQTNVRPLVMMSIILSAALRSRLVAVRAVQFVFTPAACTGVPEPHHLYEVFVARLNCDVTEQCGASRRAPEDERVSFRRHSNSCTLSICSGAPVAVPC
jgi:hypothetical protein